MENLYRGYTETKDKKCISPFKNKGSNELLTLKEAQKLSEYAGILADDVILIDIDDYDLSEILMDIVEDLQLNCRVYGTTRGKHFLFKNSKNSIVKCYTHVNLACGLIADIKVGSKNSYEVLKYNDKEREIIYDIFENEEYEEVPKFLYPVKSKINFSDLGEGDGRNQQLFNYILTLQASEFTKDEARDCLEIINKYVIKDSLSEKELEVIMRDEAFKKDIFFAGNTFLFDKFANYLMNNAYIVSMNDNLFIYKDGIYINGDKYIEQEMIKNIPLLNQTKRKEVLKYLDLIVPEVSQSDARYMAFENGIYDIVEKVLLPFNKDIVLTNKIPWNYNPEAYNELADRTLNKLSCKDSEIRAILEESIGYCFYRRNELRKSFFCVGEKSTGKSTFLELIHFVLGKSNTSTLSLDDIGDRFRTAEVYGKLSNIGDDIEDNFKGKAGTFKNLVSGSQITVERKGKDPFTMEMMYTKFFFSANKMPYFKDKAIMDRLIILPFKASITNKDKDFDPYIKYKLLVREVAEYLINIGLAGLERVLTNKCFTHSEAVDKEMEDYEEKNNPIVGYLKELTLDDFNNKSVNDCYIQYCLWADEEGLNQHLGKREFSRNVNKTFDLITEPRKINNKMVRIYKKN